MDARQFRREFAHIATAPGGVRCLRELVIYLAIHGRLFWRGTGAHSDLSAQVLEVADQAKRSLLDRSGSQRERSLPALSGEEERLFPAGWVVTRLGRVIHLISGHHLSADEQNTRRQGIAYLTGAFDFGPVHPVVSRWTTTTRAVALEGDVLLAVKGSTLGKTNILNLERAALGRQLMAARPLGVEGAFLHLILKGHEQYFLAKGVGIAIPGISREDVLHLPVGIPGLDEQRLIVRKAHELLSLCDKLELQLQQREKLCALARRATFYALATSPVASLKTAWRRATNHAPILLDSAQSVQSYRGAILDLAMSGALAPSMERNSDFGEKLLLDIEERRQLWCQTAKRQEAKEALAMQRKVRRQARAQLDLPIPAHWSWASILQISQVIIDCHHKTAPYVARGIHLVRTPDIRNRKMDLSRTRKVSAETYAIWASRLPPRENDIVLTREAPMGEAAIVPDNETVCLGQRTMLIRLFPDLFNSRFLLYAIYSPSFQSRMLAAAIGLTVKHLRVGDVEGLPVPVPPKREQDQIVSLVDRLMADFDQLEDLLVQRLKVASDLARAVMESITGIHIGNRYKMIKAPKTEVVSALRVGATPKTDDPAPLAKILGRNNGELPAGALWSSSGLEIGDFYQQLRAEMSRGWIVQPEPAYVREIEEDNAPITS